MHRFGIGDPIGVGEIAVVCFAEFVHAFPLNQPVAAIHKHQNDKRQMLTHGGFQLLTVHHQPAVAGDDQYALIGRNELGGQRAGQGEAHRCETVGNQAGLGLVAVIVTGDPHLVRAYVGEQNVARTHDFAHVDQHALRLHGERSVRRIAFMLGDELLTDG